LPGEGDVYRVSYTSLVILLLAFFVFIVSLTTPDAIRVSNVRSSIEEQFGGESEERAAQDARVLSDLARAANFEVKRSADKILITMPGSSVFESGSNTVRPEMVAPLMQIAAAVRDLELVAVIEGHTDNVPIQSTQFPSNWELSAARAASVLKIFLEQGVASERLAAAGRGEFIPVASNDSDEGRAQNRRVTLLLSSGINSKTEGA
jgi:chemotaxis protein MotB